MGMRGGRCGYVRAAPLRENKAPAGPCEGGAVQVIMVAHLYLHQDNFCRMTARHNEKEGFSNWPKTHAGQKQLWREDFPDGPIS